MSNKLRKCLVVMLSLCFCVCAISTLLIFGNTAKAAVNLNSVSISVEEGAKIKTTSPTGIKFKATVSKTDFDALKNGGYDSVKYGFILAPKDYVGTAEMDIDGWTIPGTETTTVRYEGGTPNTGTKYFQVGEANPIVNTDNINEYFFTGIFQNINASNYDRDFAVRAYIAVDDGGSTQYIYSNQYCRSVYSVAANYLANGGDDDFVSGVVGYVNNKLIEDNSDVTLTMNNITNPGQAPQVDDEVSFEMSFVNRFGDTIKATPVLSGVNGYLEATEDGTYKVISGYKFNISASLDGVVGIENKNIVKTTSIGSVYSAETATYYITPDALIPETETNFFKTKELTDATLTLATAPDGTENTILYSTATAGASNSITLGTPEIIEGKYFSFKYYNEGLGWGYNEGLTVKNTASKVNDAYNGKFTFNQYTQYGEPWTVGQNLNEWITVEINIEKLGNGAATKNVFHIDAGQSNSRLYFKDFKVSDRSLTENYTNLSIDSISGGSGQNGEFKDGDEVIVTAMANYAGNLSKLSVDNSLIKFTATNNAIKLVDGKLIYQGTGDFTLSAYIWGATATDKQCEGIVALKSEKLTNADLTKSVETTTIQTVASVDGKKSPQNNDIYHIMFSQPTGSQGDKDNVTFNKEKIYAGSYLTFAYYNQGQAFGISVGTHYNYSHANNYVFALNGINTLSGATYGNSVIKHFAQDSTLIVGSATTDGTTTNPNYNRTNYQNEWAYVEFYFESVPTADNIMLFMSQHVSNQEIYISDITVTNYSLLDYYTDLSIEVSGGTGAEDAFVKGDKVVIEATSTNKVGESVGVPVGMLDIVYSEGALTLDANGDYIYNGNGDFDLTASMFGFTDTVSNIKGIVKIDYIDLSSSSPTSYVNDFVTLDGDATLTKAVVPDGDTTSTLAKAVNSKPIADQDVYVYHSEGTQTANAMWLGGKGTASTLKGKYLIFSYYSYIGNYATFGYYEADITNVSERVNDNYMGKFVAKNYNQSGELVVPTSNIGQWITVELHIETLAGSTGRFHLKHADGKNMYITGVRVSDVPLYPEA